jgi:hypothetical protein
MERPRIPSMKISGELKDRMMGNISGRETAKIRAPNTPPNAVLKF